MSGLLAQQQREIERTEGIAKKLDQRPKIVLVPDSNWPQPLAEAAYHGLAGEVVRTIEPHTESDPVALLLQFLAFFGSCINRSAYYLVEGDKHFANLFLVMVGQSSKLVRAQVGEGFASYMKCS